MSPSRDPPDSSFEDQFTGLDLHILGLGTEYPAINLAPEDLGPFAKRFYPSTPALEKVLAINHYTGIDTRSSIGTIDHPIVNKPEPPTIADLCEVFLKDGVALSVTACRKAIAEWGGSVDEITHVVATTCTNSANPGFDHYVVKELGVSQSVEKVLLHGVGCSGGLAALRTAANLALGASYQKKPARILVLACEISSVLARSELESIHQNQEVRIGLLLFSDCASCVVLSNGIGDNKNREPIYDLLGWKHEMLHDTEKELGFDVDPHGWKVVLTPKVPELAASSVPPIFEKLVRSVPELAKRNNTSPSNFDWALHPGGSTIITGVEEVMDLTPEFFRASYDIYINHGNSSSATIFSVMNRLREMGEGKEYVVGCAFGPGISVEMAMLRRRRGIEGLPTEALD
ncbi:MAG: hypothetical protein M1830_007576 [Pleopsidium flavum]|nr:MAG: hypothetical protein M1830_007576 [Pleopsidium flavum]